MTPTSTLTYEIISTLRGLKTHYSWLYKEGKPKKHNSSSQSNNKRIVNDKSKVRELYEVDKEILDKQTEARKDVRLKTCDCLKKRVYAHNVMRLVPVITSLRKHG